MTLSETRTDKTQQSPADLLGLIRAEPPLVQCITNFVAMNIAANVLLSAGASPAMVGDAEEAGEFAQIAGALTVNIGTLSPQMMEGARAAIAGAHAAGRPGVFDPVACQATAYRRGQGVDGRDAVETAEDGAGRLAEKTGAVVAVTGEVDYVTDGKREARVGGGSSFMPMNTAMGCSLTGLCGAYAAVAGDPFDAAVGALAHFAVAGTRAHKDASGPGSFAVLFLDALHAVGPDELSREAQVTA